MAGEPKELNESELTPEELQKAIDEQAKAVGKKKPAKRATPKTSAKTTTKKNNFIKGTSTEKNS